MTGSRAEWPGSRDPEPPEAFDPWEEFQPRGDLAGGLLEAGLDRLDRALERKGRDREAAFLLLEADGYLTYACEAVTESQGSEEHLLEILKEIGGRIR